MIISVTLSQAISRIRASTLFQILNIEVGYLEGGVSLSLFQNLR